jgi:hypothetical protein
MGMVNTTVTLKPRDQWRQGMTVEKLQGEMDARLQFPGFPNVWTQPIRNRLDIRSLASRPGRDQNPRFGPERDPADRQRDRSRAAERRRDAQRLRRARGASVLHRHPHRPGSHRAAWADRRRRRGRHRVGDRRPEHHEDDRGPRAVPRKRAIRTWFPGEPAGSGARARQDVHGIADSRRRSSPTSR